MKRIVDFKYYGDKLFLNYLSVDYRVNWYDPDTDKLSFETELSQQLLINHVFPEPEEKIGVTQKMRSYGLQYQDLPSGEPAGRGVLYTEFWKVCKNCNCALGEQVILLPPV